MTALHANDRLACTPNSRTLPALPSHITAHIHVIPSSLSMPSHPNPMHSASGRTHATTITTHVPLAYLPQSGTLGTESSTDAGMCCVVCGACWLHMVHMRVPGVNSVVGKAVGMHMRTHTRTHTRTHAHSHAHTHAHAKSPSEVLVNDRGTRTDRAGLAERERCRV